ncbi:hypothetical protein CFIMG_007860RA00001 [Ceratocystis fimbriata CBS 114723]|uniref:Uncharacterized protein n=1 Tax=Ceratocystis fimbriata CBS 114723 TaxID=1035309 RepID=A0A2C5WE86_9PEZI|nr:hypothetical protein CFIMG_007860RA00001 [Ceratocystis fimbriata CBS 114723]
MAVHMPQCQICTTPSVPIYMRVLRYTVINAQPPLIRLYTYHPQSTNMAVSVKRENLDIQPRAA